MTIYKRLAKAQFIFKSILRNNLMTQKKAQQKNKQNATM